MINRLKTNLLKILYRDELIGDWETTSEGGFQVVMGSRLTFRRDGTGSLESWGEQFENSDSDEFLWLRVSSKRIEIKRVNHSSFTEVTYKIEEYINPYGNLYFELTEPSYNLCNRGIKGFWNIPGELYRKVY